MGGRKSCFSSEAQGGCTAQEDRTVVAQNPDSTSVNTDRHEPLWVAELSAAPMVHFGVVALDGRRSRMQSRLERRFQWSRKRLQLPRTWQVSQAVSEGAYVPSLISCAEKAYAGQGFV